jgi:CRP/FNR family transcriptional regulator, cyclic AMP receptor protein
MAAMRSDPSPTRLELLRGVPGFRGRTDRELAAAARLLEEAEVAEGTVLIREGADGQQAYVILEGWAAVTVHGEPVAALGPGQFVGEMAMLDRGPRSATVVAKTTMRLLSIGPEAFESFTGQPDITRSIARSLSERLRRQEAGQASNESSAQLKEEQ